MGKKIKIEEEKIEEEKPIKQKNSSLLVIILVLIILLMGGYILNEKGLLPINFEIKNEPTLNEENTDKTNTPQQEESSEEQKQEESVSEQTPSQEPIIANKSLNTSGIEYKNITPDESNYGLSMKINPKLNNVIIIIDWDKFGPIASPIVGGFTWATGAKEELNINGFSSKIKDVYIGDIGQDATGITLFYLMENGTVEYTKLFTKKFDGQGNLSYQINYHYNYSAEGKATTNGFISSGELKGVNEIVKLYNADATGGMSSWKTVLAAKQDGSTYDLGNILKEY